MDRLLKTFSPSTTSFEETFKTAYSHGLEEIYTLENVDIASIKTISVEQVKPVERKEIPLPMEPFLDLGGEFNFDLEPFYLDEPIHVLQLPLQTERNLMDKGFHLLRDLPQEYLRDYLRGKRLERCRSIDFTSFLRCITGSQERKKAKIALEPYMLDEIIPLTPIESLEIKRLSSVKKRELQTEFEARIAHKKGYVKNKMDAICDVLLKTWMRGRLGFATRLELLERVEMVSLDPELSGRALTWLSTLFFEGLFPFALVPIEEDLFASDIHVKVRFSKVEAKALSYFYKPTLFYTLEELSLWIKREFAREWIGFEEGFVEKVLRSSSQFRIRKEEKLIVRLA